MPNTISASAVVSAPEVLIATIGVASQVGTLTFDELYFARQIPIRHVVWIHTNEAGPMMVAPVANVRREVEKHYAQRCPDVTFEFVTIEGRDGKRPLDTQSEGDSEAVMFTLHNQIRKWKDAGYSVHLSISGGRKVMSAFGVVAAQLNFNSEHDKCWHLMSEDLLAKRELMHAEAGNPEHKVVLVPVPVLRWANYKGFAPRSLAEAIANDPLHAQEIAQQLSEDEVQGLRHEFFERELDESEREILERLALNGWENAEIDSDYGGNCKNVVTRIWKKYCDFANDAKRFGEQRPLGENLDRARVKRGRLIADFHLIVQQITRDREAKKARAKSAGTLSR